MKQQFENYTVEDFKVWKTLFERQVNNLQDKSCESYLHCLDELNDVLNSNSIPRFDALSKVLKEKTGWSIEVVPGLIPVEDFFELLSQKKFCSSTWLRSMEQLDYLEEPDMFHDIFGHIPLFMDEKYADFAQKMGEVGVQFKDSEKILIELQRIYRFTIEFGLLKGSQPQIYGAGVISSFGETNFIYEEGTEMLPFDLNEIINTDFCNSEIQTKYFLLNSFDELYESFEKYVMKVGALASF
ncbi:MAG: phenylalanine-4-hydroxylase [Flavobacteriales bacterium]|nr:phenylalanine-4-hydroxylase [Flavobacteriales bacterium]